VTTLLQYNFDNAPTISGGTFTVSNAQDLGINTFDNVTITGAR
jgi:hypothetical protein